jgi:hypothetical protein
MKTNNLQPWHRQKSTVFSEKQQFLTPAEAVLSVNDLSSAAHAIALPVAALGSKLDKE